MYAHHLEVHKQKLLKEEIDALEAELRLTNVAEDRPGVDGIMSLTKAQDVLKRLPDIQLAKEVINAYITQGCSIVRNADVHAQHLHTECPR